MLKGDPNRTSAGDDRLAFEQHLSLGRDEESCEDPSKCRLARPVVPGDHDALAPVKIEIDALQRATGPRGSVRVHVAQLPYAEERSPGHTRPPGRGRSGVYGWGPRAPGREPERGVGAPGAKQGGSGGGSSGGGGGSSGGGVPPVPRA